jgi:DNA primase
MSSENKKKKFADIEKVKKNLPKLQEIISGRKIQKGKYIYVDPCPICGHKGHFVIDTTKNTYKSFACTGEGGTVIDWLMKHEGQNWKGIFELSGIEPESNSIREIREKRELKEIELKRIENSFFKIYENLVFIYKTLNKNRENLNKLGIWLLNFSDFWTNEFSKTGTNTEDKLKVLESFINDISVEMKMEKKEVKKCFM